MANRWTEKPLTKQTRVWAKQKEGRKPYYKDKQNTCFPESKKGKGKEGISLVDRIVEQTG